VFWNDEMFNPVELLKPLHVTERFDCGKEPLNVFLKKYALQSQSSLAARTFVITLRDGRVAGYYSLAAGSVEHGHAPTRVIKGLARHPVPVILLARIAVDKEFQGEGLGEALLKDALLRSVKITEQLAARAILAHAKDDESRNWYKKHDFEESPTDPYHLFLLMKDAKRGLDP
jgi:GNAT superfamily N-acetyltransferase